MKVVWTEQAAARLEEIEAHVAEDSPPAAARLVDRIVTRGESLGRLPRRGRVVPELPGLRYRELIEGSYRIVYRVDEAAVVILTVFEGHRLLRLAEL